MPGTAVDTMSSAPLDMSRREIRLIAWSSRYSTSASSGVSVRARTSAGVRRLSPPASTTSS